jgi:hypothetical protein
LLFQLEVLLKISTQLKQVPIEYTTVVEGSIVFHQYIVIRIFVDRAKEETERKGLGVSHPYLAQSVLKFHLKWQQPESHPT